MSYKMTVKQIFDLLKEEIPLGRCQIYDRLNEWLITIDCKGNYGEIHVPKWEKEKIEYDIFFDGGGSRSGTRKNDLFPLLTSFYSEVSDCKAIILGLVNRHGKNVVNAALKNEQVTSSLQ